MTEPHSASAVETGKRHKHLREEVRNGPSKKAGFQMGSAQWQEVYQQVVVLWHDSAANRILQQGRPLGNPMLATWTVG